MAWEPHGSDVRFHITLRLALLHLLFERLHAELSRHPVEIPDEVERTADRKEGEEDVQDNAFGTEINAERETEKHQRSQNEARQDVDGAEGLEAPRVRRDPPREGDGD